MRIAVIVPVHNDGADLWGALRSIRRQERLPDELIVVDDHSTDAATLEELAELERRPPVPATRVIHLPDDRGVSEARMVAIDAATADAILPLDGDDMLLPRALRLLERALLEDPGASFASGHVRYFGARRGGATVPRFNPYLELDQNPMMPLALFRAAVFRERGLRYAPLRAYEDWGLWLAIAQAGLRGAQVEEPVYRYRRKRSGLLAWGHRHKDELQGKLRALFPSLYADEGRARLKERHAPALEIAWSGAPGDPALAAFLAAQTLGDVSVTPRSARTARELLAASRGKVLLQFSPAQLALLGDARPSLLEQAVRCVEGHATMAAVAVPLDRVTLEAGARLPRLSVLEASRFAAEPLDLFFLRVQRAAGLRSGHLPAEAPARGLVSPFVRRGEVLLFAEDFARLAAEVPAKGVSGLAPPLQTTRVAAVVRAVQAAAPLWKRARRLAEKTVGKERLGSLLHPLKLRADELSLDAEALAVSLREGRTELGTAPLLPPSVRAEKEWLDAVPTRFAPISPRRRERPRALLVMPWIVHGGVDRAVIDLARALRADGWELFAATHEVASHDWERRLLGPAQDVYLLGETAPDDRGRALVEVARSLDPDVLFLVHSWVALESLSALRAALPELRTVDYQHMDYQTPGGNFARVSCERNDAQIDLRAVSTRYLMSRYQAYGVAPGKVRLVRAGCDEQVAFNPDRFPRGLARSQLGIPAGATLLGFVGRFVLEKDPLFVLRVFAAIDAAAQARGSAPLHFAMVGDGPLRGETEARAAALGLGERVHFLPPDTDVAAVLRDLDLLLMASRTEGLPLVFFEALSLRTPVVTTAIEGIAELIDDEVGACVPDLPDPDARCRALLDAALPLVLDPARRAAAGEAGRRRIAEHFAAEATGKAWVEIFRELLG